MAPLPLWLQSRPSIYTLLFGKTLRTGDRRDVHRFPFVEKLGLSTVSAIVVAHREIDSEANYFYFNSSTIMSRWKGLRHALSGHYFTMWGLGLPDSIYQTLRCRRLLLNSLQIQFRGFERCVPEPVAHSSDVNTSPEPLIGSGMAEAMQEEIVRILLRFL